MSTLANVLLMEEESFGNDTPDIKSVPHQETKEAKDSKESSSETTLETSVVYFETVRAALIRDSDDALQCYKYSHRPSDTPLFLSNGFVTENSRLTVLWAFQWTDQQKKLVKTYKKIRQEVNPTFQGSGLDTLVTLRSMNSYPPTNVTNELVAEFLGTLQREFPDIVVKKVKPTKLETASIQAHIEQKEAETKREQDKYTQAYQDFKHLQEESKGDSLEGSFYDGAGVNPSAWINQDEALPTSYPISDNPRGETPPQSSLDGSCIFQASKLKEQIAIVYNEICNQFQPIGGFVDSQGIIQLKDTCFATTDLQQAFEKWTDEIWAKKSVMMQITPIHLQAQNQIWIRFVTDNQVIEIDRDSFGLFVECKYSQPLQAFTINRFFPLFNSTNKRKQEVINLAVESFMNRVDKRLQDFLAKTTFVPAATSIPIVPAVISKSTATKTPAIATETSLVPVPSKVITPLSSVSPALVIPSKDIEIVHFILPNLSGALLPGPILPSFNPKQRAEINLNDIQEVEPLQSLPDSLPENPVMRIHSSVLKKGSPNNNNNTNKRRGARFNGSNKANKAKKETLF